jgi:acyl-CoA thioesterase II
VDDTDTHTAPPRSRASVDDVLRVLDLERLDDGRWQGTSVAVEATVVFAGQLIGQAIVAATAEVPGKKVKSVHSVFARAGRTDQPLTFDVERLHDGRSMGSLSITASQGDRRLARSLLLLDVAEGDLIKHASDAPAAGPPESAHPQATALEGWDQRFVEDVDLFDPTVVGAPELRIWSRFDTGRSEPAIARALLGWASVGSFIGTAMRPHPGMGLARAHKDVSTGVLSHSLTFHDEFAAGDWLLFALRSPFAGGGKAFGAGEVFTADGRMVASCTQEAMIRPMPTNGGSRL